jgi:hypothetical protein
MLSKGPLRRIINCSICKKKLACAIIDSAGIGSVVLAEQNRWGEPKLSQKTVCFISGPDVTSHMFYLSSHVSSEVQLLSHSINVAQSLCRHSVAQSFRHYC